MLHSDRGGPADSKPDFGGFDSCMEHNMKPYNLGNKLSSGTTSPTGSWKVDYHLHTRKGRKIENWWEGMVNYISRSTRKQQLKKDINETDKI